MRGALQCTHPRGLWAARTSAHAPCLAVVPRVPAVPCACVLRVYGAADANRARVRVSVCVSFRAR
eukprot:2866860-Prymnesium_polylepis.1